MAPRRRCLSKAAATVVSSRSRCYIAAALGLGLAKSSVAEESPSVHVPLRLDVRYRAELGGPQPREEENEGGDVAYPRPYASSTEAEVERSTSDGVLVSIGLPKQPPPADGDTVPVSLFMQLFTLSYASPFKVVEQWFLETGAAPRHAHLRFTSLFDTFLASQEYPGLWLDDHGDVCVGYLLKAELCLQAMGCVPLGQASAAGHSSWPADDLELWLPTPVATNYRLEAYVSADECHANLESPPLRLAGRGQEGWHIRRLRRLSEAPSKSLDGAFLLNPRVHLASHFLHFRVLFVDEPSSWWAEKSDARPWSGLQPAQCWMDMMGNALVLAEPWFQHSSALWLEFGVASGRSLAFIAARLKAREVSSHIVVHGFDSFMGIPQGWHRYNAESFGMEGKPPEFLEATPNVQLHIGYFSETLKDLDGLRTNPVAFAHIDVDLFSSAREVLSYLRCQLVPGTILVFDEWFNYPGWQRGGEYRAWRLFAEMYQVKWRPLGFFFEQAVPIQVESVPRDCGVNMG